jgi:hypothetical protein
VTTLFEPGTAQRLYTYILLFLMGFNVIIWTFGVFWMTSEHRRTIDLRKVFNPPVLTTVITMILIAVGIQDTLPEAVLKPISMIGDCTLPMAIMILGGNLALTEFKSVDRKPLLVFLLGKMIVLPGLAFIGLALFEISPWMAFIILIEAAVPSAVTLSFMGRYLGVDTNFVNQAIVYGHGLGIITIPMWVFAWSAFLS